MLAAQSCPTFCDPRDWGPPVSSVNGILQAKILECVAIPFSRGNLPDPGIKPGSPALQADSLPSEGKPQALQVLSRFSRVQLFATLWTIACQALHVMGFSRQEYWSGLPCPSPGDLPDPGIKFASLTSPSLAGGFFTTSATWKASAFHKGSIKLPSGSFQVNRLQAEKLLKKNLRTICTILWILWI